MDPRFLEDLTAAYKRKFRSEFFLNNTRFNILMNRLTAVQRTEFFDSVAADNASAANAVLQKEINKFISDLVAVEIAKHEADGYISNETMSELYPFFC